MLSGGLILKSHCAVICGTPLWWFKHCFTQKFRAHTKFDSTTMFVLTTEQRESLIAIQLKLWGVIGKIIFFLNAADK